MHIWYGLKNKNKVREKMGHKFFAYGSFLCCGNVEKA